MWKKCICITELYSISYTVAIEIDHNNKYSTALSSIHRHVQNNLSLSTHPRATFHCPIAKQEIKIFVKIAKIWSENDLDAFIQQRKVKIWAHAF